jgi:hypothetical protein
MMEAPQVAKTEPGFAMTIVRRQIPLALTASSQPVLQTGRGGIAVASPPVNVSEMA